jgi:hypothetical protein
MIDGTAGGFLPNAGDAKQIRAVAMDSLTYRRSPECE